MDPTLEEKQKKQGVISRGINSVNNLRGANRLFSNPLGRIASRVVAQTALRGFASFLASQAGLPILIALGAILFFTLIIILGFGGAPPTSETVTPTPAAP